MAFGVPATVTLICPRCHVSRRFGNVDGGTTFRCAACDYYLSLAPVAPTGTGTAAVPVGGTAITVASGGASFTNGMILLYDTGSNAEVVTVNGVPTATNIPVTPFAKAHGTSTTFGQLQISLQNGTVINAGYASVSVQGAPPVTPTAAELAAYPNAF